MIPPIIFHIFPMEIAILPMENHHFPHEKTEARRLVAPAPRWARRGAARGASEAIERWLRRSPGNVNHMGIDIYIYIPILSIIIHIIHYYNLSTIYWINY